MLNLTESKIETGSGAELVPSLLAKAQDQCAQLLDAERGFMDGVQRICVRKWELGKTLAELKKLIPHGGWISFAVANFPMLGESEESRRRRASEAMAFFAENSNGPISAHFTDESIRQYIWHLPRTEPESLPAAVVEEGEAGEAECPAAPFIAKPTLMESDPEQTEAREIVAECEVLPSEEDFDPPAADDVPDVAGPPSEPLVPKLLVERPRSGVPTPHAARMQFQFWRRAIGEGWMEWDVPTLRMALEELRPIAEFAAELQRLLVTRDEPPAKADESKAAKLTDEDRVREHFADGDKVSVVGIQGRLRIGYIAAEKIMAALLGRGVIVGGVMQSRAE